MPPKGQPHKNQNRVRPTQRSVEAKQFSTVRLPRSSEIAVNNSAIHEHNQVPSTSGGFDPISNDGMFTVVANSSYWPPMPLDQLLERAPVELLGKVRTDEADIGSDSSDDGVDVNSMGGDSEDDNAKPSSSASIPTKQERIKEILSNDGGMDLYDRRKDEAKARKALSKVKKEAGLLSHPRGKAPVNSKKTFDDDE